MEEVIKKRVKRQKRVREKIRSVTTLPRLSVFRSNKRMYAQIIDDQKGVTLLGVAEKSLTGSKTERARSLGQEIARLAKEKQITRVVFDKGRYAYHGRVKAFAEGAREGGLQF
ncbi:MAG: 50S ribosomal protein L18 [Patescibacteria group bacterium]|jgi:large subunit ribosomal protein L18|nr:MAG: 50S ribosomal protein L18 [Patescibacteria group bacterium]